MIPFVFGEDVTRNDENQSGGNSISENGQRHASEDDKGKANDAKEEKLQQQLQDAKDKLSDLDPSGFS